MTESSLLTWATTFLKDIQIFDLLKYCAGPLSGSFAGAFLAYKLTAKREAYKQRQERIQAAQEVLYFLSYHLNTVYALYRQLFMPKKDHTVRHLSIPGSIIKSYENYNIDVKPISFLLSEEDPCMLGHISTCNDFFFTIVGSINKRSELHSIFLDILDKEKVPSGVSLDDEKLKMLVGERVLKQLEEVTNAIYLMTDKYLKEVGTTSENLRKLLQRIYPECKFNCFVIDEKYKK